MTMGHGIYGLPEPELPKKPLSRWRYVWRAALFFLFLGGMAMFVLSQADGTGDDNKALMEEILSDIVAPDFQIGTLNALTYSPVVAMDMSHVTFGKRSRIERVQYATGLWSWVFSRIEFRALGIRNGLLEGGVFFFPRDLDIRELWIDPTIPSRPVLRLDGRYDGRAISLVLPMEYKPTFFGHPRFVFPETMSVQIEWGDLKADLAIHDPFGLRSEYKIISLTRAGGAAWTGMIALEPEWTGTAYKGHFARDTDRMDFSLHKPQDENKPVTGTLSVNSLTDPAWDDMIALIQRIRGYYKGLDSVKTIDIQDVDVIVRQADGTEKSWIIRDQKSVSNPFASRP